MVVLTKRDILRFSSQFRCQQQLLLHCQVQQQQNPTWQTNCSSVSRECLHLLWSSKVHYHIDKSLPLFTVLSQINPVHTLLSYFFNIPFHISFPSVCWFSKWSLFSTFFHQNHVHISFFSLLHATCPTHIISLDLVLIIQMVFDRKYN